ncbi:MAG: hypothetical protein JRN68_09555 [Nitrososphaerota archaeon]|nr:hypothetical protein [Nitrososphaerota archaeon]
MHKLGDRGFLSGAEHKVLRALEPLQVSQDRESGVHQELRLVAVGALYSYEVAVPHYPGGE